ncbi:hypothetical protein ACLQ2D_17480 [Streptomyces sp. DT199]|uniref:hypothetical protein n=1 Tax=Streptomyces sp. DT199 TaxID=3393421 RepID=UPI003CE6E447
MAFGVAAIGALYRGFLGTDPQSPGPDTDLADFAAAFDRTAYVLAALAVGTALLAFRLGRVPAGAAVEDGEGAAGRTGAGPG